MCVLLVCTDVKLPDATPGGLRPTDGVGTFCEEVDCPHAEPKRNRAVTSRAEIPGEPIRRSVVTELASGYTSLENLSDHHKTTQGSKPLSSSVYEIHAKAKMNASAPTEPTSARPMWIQVLIRSVMGVMSGPARKTI